MAQGRYSVIFRRQARDEAIAAAQFIAEQGHPETALQWYDALAEAIESLAAMPARCPFAREDALFPGVELRELLFKSHRIIFTIRGKTVHVLHVRHASRQGLDEL